ncbi:DUF1178 family protein [Thermosulfuriphilus ammonigenes]|uniref:DUF1178 family protein n=1 Tax=Thermosulfuriphilus ammonigenes TaxID=1936021 RepID=A0A6G7PTU5_9BACT|nr:DUF1178 family protein [Thermosulfuriphilus ammonigenes]MBA2849254.1 hypothetical protein [Thermosulfuriphilus ammonigenes]QIJ70868.1 DUF1178 family protein [Thermosulfuriphilus ammonigenes]
MIVFDLSCENNHVFEGWFADRASYEEQVAKGLINCPFCGSQKIRKILSPVAIKKSRDSQHQASTPEAKMLNVLYQISRYVEKNFEDVGARFAEEALKIHYGIEEPRAIRGVATEEEEKILKEEGVEFLKVPVIRKSEH